LERRRTRRDLPRPGPEVCRRLPFRIDVSLPYAWEPGCFGGTGPDLTAGAESSRKRLSRAAGTPWSPTARAAAMVPLGPGAVPIGGGTPLGAGCRDGAEERPRQAAGIPLLRHGLAPRSSWPTASGGPPAVSAISPPTTASSAPPAASSPCGGSSRTTRTAHRTSSGASATTRSTRCRAAAGARRSRPPA
jgi:hypothetical protein